MFSVQKMINKTMIEFQSDSDKDMDCKWTEEHVVDQVQVFLHRAGK